MNWSGNFREGLAREIRENKTLAKITAYTVFDFEHILLLWGLKTISDSEPLLNYPFKANVYLFR